MQKNKRIGIDARFYGSIGKGLGRYTQEVVDNIITLDQENEYVIFLRKENFNELNITHNPRVKKVLAEIRWYSLAEQLILPWLIFKQRLDLMHFAHFNVPVLCPTKFVVTIHDLILINHPTKQATTLGPLLYWIKNLGYRVTIKIALIRAKEIIAVSQFTKDDIVNHFKTRPEKISVTYEGVAEFANHKNFDSTSDKHLLDKFKISYPFILYVGNAYPHKNLVRLLSVFKSILKTHPGTQLVLVGKEDHFYSIIKQSAAELDLLTPDDISPVIFTDFVNDLELAALYRQARIYVFASLYEGFGLPPLEAMANNLPVACSNTTSMPEILGDAAYYFNPRNEKDMAEKIVLLFDNQNLREELIKKGISQASKYSWQNCAEKTLGIYRKILG